MPALSPSVVAAILSCAWLALVGLVGAPGLFAALAIPLYAGTLFALHRLDPGPAAIARPMLLLCALAFILLIFTLWGQLLYSFSVPVPDTSPRPLKIAALFVPAPLLTLALAVLFAYPLARLFPRRYWAVPVLAAALVLGFQYRSFLAGSERTLIQVLLVYEFLCLLALLPLLLRLAIPGIEKRRQAAQGR